MFRLCSLPLPVYVFSWFSHWCLQLLLLLLLLLLLPAVILVLCLERLMLSWPFSCTAPAVYVPLTYHSNRFFLFFCVYLFFFFILIYIYPCGGWVGSLCRVMPRLVWCFLVLLTATRLSLVATKGFRGFFLVHTNRRNDLADKMERRARTHAWNSLQSIVTWIVVASINKVFNDLYAYLYIYIGIVSCVFNWNSICGCGKYTTFATCHELFVRSSNSRWVALPFITLKVVLLSVKDASISNNSIIEYLCCRCYSWGLYTSFTLYLLFHASILSVNFLLNTRVQYGNIQRNSITKNPGALNCLYECVLYIPHTIFILFFSLFVVVCLGSEG